MTQRNVRTNKQAVKEKNQMWRWVWDADAGLGGEKELAQGSVPSLGQAPQGPQERPKGLPASLGRDLTEV